MKKYQSAIRENVFFWVDEIVDELDIHEDMQELANRKKS